MATLNNVPDWMIQQALESELENIAIHLRNGILMRAAHLDVVSQAELFMNEQFQQDLDLLDHTLPCFAGKAIFCAYKDALYVVREAEANSVEILD